MRVEVITRHASRNYGALLQAIGTAELLSTAGHQARFVDYRQSNHEDTGWSIANMGSARNLPWIGRVAYAALRHPGVRRIGRFFEAEMRENLTLTNRQYRSSLDLDSSSEFDDSAVYCVGSDQVWNIEHNLDNTPYHLDFAPSGATKFSLSSSIGMSALPREWEKRLVVSLHGFSGVSVREKTSAEYLQTLGVLAEQHVDPTLGVSPGYWRKFAANARVPHEPYVLVYQLNESATFGPVLESVSSALSLPVKRIEYWRGPRSLRQPSVVLPSLSEFVRLFRDAEAVVTDSFHGVVFSTIFSCPYVAVPPPKYAVRLQSLLEMTDQSHRLVEGAGAASDVIRSSSPLRDVETLLESERLRVHGYLSRVLDVP